MEAVIERQIEVLREEPLSLDIRTNVYQTIGKTTEIAIGNSGMRFVILGGGENETASMHFLPDGEEGFNKVSFQDKMKFSNVFCAAFHEFYEYWKNEDNFKDVKRPKFISGTTNETMSNFLENLFNTEENIIYQTIVKDPYFFKISLESLEKNPQAIDTMKSAFVRCQGKDIKMKIVNFKLDEIEDDF